MFGIRLMIRLVFGDTSLEANKVAVSALLFHIPDANLLSCDVMFMNCEANVNNGKYNLRESPLNNLLLRVKVNCKTKEVCRAIQDDDD